MTDTQHTSNNAALRPIPDHTTWEILLDAYKKVKRDKDPHDQILFETIQANPTGFAIEYQARHIPHKGRGLFCTQDIIAKGATVCYDVAGRFYTEAQWREFLGLIPPGLALDCVDWAGVAEDDSDSESDSEDEQDDAASQFVFLDFCDSVMFNHGSTKEGKANCKGKECKDGTWRMIATRDISAGEELLCDYALTGVGYDHGLDWYTKIHEEYYPGVPIDASELERFS